MAIADPKGLSGTSVAGFVRPIVGRIGTKAVITADVEGAGIAALQEAAGQVLSCDDFLNKVERATQYDWAFFFFYSTDPTPEEADVSDLTAAIQKAHVTVRLADDTYFYVYGRDKVLMNELRRSYPQAEFKVAKFSALDVPY
jgi:hypothetical protein